MANPTYISLREIAEQKLGISYGALRQYILSHPDEEWPEVRQYDKNRRLWILKDVPKFRDILKERGVL